jgi:GT2 family glycosyltransferase
LTGHDETPMSRGRRVPDAPVVSVCIPVVSAHGLIEGCLDSLNGSLQSVDTEVVVVANGLNRDGLASLQKRDDIVLVNSAVNTGFSGGNNLAARFARGRYLLLLNDDTVIEDGYIERLVRAVERDPLVGAAGGRILSIDGTVQEAGSVLWRDGWVAHVGAGLPAGSHGYNFVRYADYVSANGLLVDRHAWDAVGGLDERYFPAYYEDVDLCLALRNHGYRVVYEPRARLTHLESQSTSTLFRGFLIIRNRGQFVQKWWVTLARFADHPEPIDDAAIDAAVLRAEQTVGRVMVIEDIADATEWQGLRTVEALANANWSVTLVVPVGRGRASADREIRDQLVDLGVDVRDDPPDRFVREYGSTIEAIVVAGEGIDEWQPFWRPDETRIPVVHGVHEPDGSVVSRVEAAARLDRLFSSSTDDPLPRESVTLSAPEWAPDAGDDLPYAEADLRVRREYCEYLESELVRTQAALDKTDIHLRKTVENLEEVGASLIARERYINALLSVRMKKWIAGQYANRKS